MAMLPWSYGGSSPPPNSGIPEEWHRASAKDAPEYLSNQLYYTESKVEQIFSKVEAIELLLEGLDFTALNTKLLRIINAHKFFSFQMLYHFHQMLLMWLRAFAVSNEDFEEVQQDIFKVTCRMRFFYDSPESSESFSSIPEFDFEEEENNTGNYYYFNVEIGAYNKLGLYNYDIDYVRQGESPDSCYIYCHYDLYFKKGFAKGSDDFFNFDTISFITDFLKNIRIDGSSSNSSYLKKFTGVPAVVSPLLPSLVGVAVGASLGVPISAAEMAVQLGTAIETVGASKKIDVLLAFQLSEFFGRIAEQYRQSFRDKMQDDIHRVYIQGKKPLFNYSSAWDYFLDSSWGLENFYVREYTCIEANHSNRSLAMALNFNDDSDHRFEHIQLKDDSDQFFVKSITNEYITPRPLDPPEGLVDYALFRYILPFKFDTANLQSPQITLYLTGEYFAKHFLLNGRMI